MKKLILAFSFLTILPFPSNASDEPPSLGGSAGWFPLVGAVIGALAAVVLYGLRLILPGPLAAVLACLVWIILTGGLHLDGLADTCDGIFNASSPQRRLEIMKDSSLGTFGGIGLIMAIILKITLLFSLPNHFLIAIPLAAASARWLLLPAAFQPQARRDGMGAHFAASINKFAFVPAALVVVLLTACSGWYGIAAVVAIHGLAWLIFAFAKKRLGGMSGDVLGFLVETSELLVLFTFCIYQ